VGHDVVPSEPFRIPFALNGLDVRVRAGSWTGRVFGTVFTILGGVFSTMGGAQLIAWDAYGQPPVSNHAARAFLPSGIAFLSVGVVLAALGIPLIVANQTRVDISEHSVAAGRTGVELTPAGLVF
jgi:hypothetical protein